MDSNAIMWDIPTQRTKKTEKYDFPVLTMSAIELKGSNRKFSLNKSAMEALGLVGGESEVNIGFKGNQVFITKKDKFRVGKNCSFSDKRVFEYLVKLWNLNTRVENEFALIAVEDRTYMELSPIADEIEVMQLGGSNMKQEDFTTNISNEELEVEEELATRPAPDEDEYEVPSAVRESAALLQKSEHVDIEDVLRTTEEDTDALDFVEDTAEDSDWE